MRLTHFPHLIALLALAVFAVHDRCQATADTLIGTQVDTKGAVAAFAPATATVTTPALYVGASAMNAKDPSYAVAAITLNTAAQVPTAKTTPLASADNVVSVNGGALAASPLNNKPISFLTTLNSLPVAVATDAALIKNVYYFAKNDGTDLRKNANAIKDSAGAAETNQIAGVATDPTTNKVFAAVSKTAVAWKDADATQRGIAVLAPTAVATDGLQVYDATDFDPAKIGATNKAAPLTLAAGPVYLGATNADITAGANAASLHWNNNLNRLYVGLDQIKRAADNADGTCLSVAMGKYATTAVAGNFELASVVDAMNKIYFADNATTGIIGFTGDVNNKACVAIAKNLYSMRTSTGKDYLIVNSNIVNGTLADNAVGVYAVPLLNDANTPAQIGTVSKVAFATGIATFDGAPTAANEMPSSAKAATQVGVIFPAGAYDAKEADITADIKDIFVQGDTVYMSVGGATNKAAGLVASTALFDTTGAIRAWTKPYRVMGQVGQVQGAGLDIDNGQFYALTSAGKTAATPFGEINTARVSLWGKTEDAVAAADNLSGLIATEFPLSKGGVTGMYSFGPGTYGFAPNFSMMVVLGPDKVMIAQTSSGAFAVDTAFSTVAATGHVKIYDTTNSPALAAIAPLTCAEVSRVALNAAETRGYLFVAGLNGVAVLNLAANTGWNTAAGQGLATINLNAPGTADVFPGNNNAWTFKKLAHASIPTGVRKMVAWNGRLYLMTTSGISYIPVAADIIDPTAVQATAVTALPAGTNAMIADLMVVAPDNDVAKNRGIVATTNGVYASNLVDASKQIAATDGQFVAQLGVLASDTIVANAPKTANLYALVVDENGKKDTVYRLDVPNSDAATALDKLVTVVDPGGETEGLYAELDSAKQGIDVDGTYVYSTRPNHYGQTDYFGMAQVSNPEVLASQDMTGALNIDTNTNKWVTGVMREAASGEVMVPGDWGVRVNG